MTKDDLVYVGHMLDTARSAVGKVAGLSREQFDTDENFQLALAFLIQTIGEAARRVSQPFQVAHSSIFLARVIGMRHKVVHDYLHVDYDIVWGVVNVELPRLMRQLSLIVEPD